VLRSDGGGLTRCHTFPVARAAILTTSPSTVRFTKRDCLFTSPPLHSELSAIAGRYANLSEEMFTHQVRKVLCVTEILEICGGGKSIAPDASAIGYCAAPPTQTQSAIHIMNEMSATWWVDADPAQVSSNQSWRFSDGGVGHRRDQLLNINGRLQKELQCHAWNRIGQDMPKVTTRQRAF
jgi:hypothetical protein